MKRFITLLLACSLIAFLLGCKKNLKKSSNTSLTGSWELRQIQAGMTPSATYLPGNGNRLIFSDVTYQKFENNALINSGNYTVVRDNSVEQSVGLVVPKGQFQQRIDFQNISIAFFQVTGNQLKLLSGFFPTDGGVSSVYEKVSD